MKVHELLNLLLHQSGDAEVRIGDTLEDGPYSHARVASISRGGSGDIILCGSDDEAWMNEDSQSVLEVLWPVEK